MSTPARSTLCLLVLAVVVTALSAGCNPSGQSRPFSLLRFEGLPVPALPQLCDGRQPAVPRGTPRQLWIVFSSQHCAQCRELLTELRGYRATLRARRVTLLTYSIDAESCAAARLETGRAGGWPIGRADVTDKASWAVRGTPTLYVIRRGKVVAKLLGRAPAHRLIATLAPRKRQR
jgi:thioredoxin-related protein